MRGRLSGPVLASAHSESATQFSAKLWDALSQRGRQRKLHPRLLTQNGSPLSQTALKRKPHPTLMWDCGKNGP